MCDYIKGSRVVMPGWACCRCRVYNGLQRTACKSCREDRHEIKVTQELFFCESCGFGSQPEHVGQMGPMCPSCKTGVMSLAREQKPAEPSE